MTNTPNEDEIEEPTTHTDGPPTPEEVGHPQDDVEDPEDED